MKSDRCILKKGSAILALTVLVTLSLKACTKEEIPTGGITLTTAASQVRIYVAGAEDIVIYWGDGKKNNLNDGTLLNFSDLFEFTHSYAGTTSHNIVITGNVVELNCSNNQLTALDVTRKVELTYLDCSNNQLTALDVSRNTALTTLACNNNPLSAFDVSKNTALEELNFGGNQIAVLDVSRNTALKYLTCSDTQITNMDVSANTALTILHVCSSQITKLDVSKNTALNILCVRRNQLTASALNDLFRTLFYVPEGNYAFIDYSENPGSFDSDQSIWKEKKWLFQPAHK